jgi:hypothetical protein
MAYFIIHNTGTRNELHVKRWLRLFNFTDSSVRIGTINVLDSSRFGPRRGKKNLFTPDQTYPGAHPASCTMSTGFFPGGLSGRGVALTTHPQLATILGLIKSIFLLPICAYMACYIDLNLNY